MNKTFALFREIKQSSVNPSVNEKRVSGYLKAALNVKNVCWNIFLRMKPNRKAKSGMKEA